MIERRMQIINDFSSNDRISVADLAEKYHVSQVTIRNDLKALQNDNLIKRVHGGASSTSNEFISARLNVNYEIKLRIAERAAQMVSSGETVFIESGSTNALLAKKLSETKDVTIITNSCFIANFIREIPRVNIVLLGGNYQPSSEVCVGPLTCQSMQSFFVDKLFIGSDGFSEKHGFTCINLLRAEVVAAMAKRAEHRIILTDSSKFSQRGVAQQLSLTEVTHVITDNGIPDSAREALIRNGVELITV